MKNWLGRYYQQKTTHPKQLSSWQKEKKRRRRRRRRKTKPGEVAELQDTSRSKRKVARFVTRIREQGQRSYRGYGNYVYRVSGRKRNGDIAESGEHKMGIVRNFTLHRRRHIYRFLLCIDGVLSLSFSPTGVLHDASKWRQFVEEVASFDRHYRYRDFS